LDVGFRQWVNVSGGVSKKRLKGFNRFIEADAPERDREGLMGKN